MFYQTQYQMDVCTMNSASLFSMLTGAATSDPAFEEKIQRLLEHNQQGLLNLLSVNHRELTEVFGFDDSGAAALSAFVELALRLTQTVRFRGLRMEDSGTVADYYMELLCHQRKELVIAVFFDSKCRFIADEVHSIGSHNASIVSTRDIFHSALRADSAHFILLHNHPSGEPSPSREDREITRQLLLAGKIMGISLMDHIIIGDHCYFSFKEKRLLE